jgi:lipoic acid synthetase
VNASLILDQPIVEIAASIFVNHYCYLCSAKNWKMETVLDNNLPIVGKPKWLKVKLPIGQKYTELRGLVDKYKLNTICTSGSCPNMGECWGEGTATFMILGNICTRSCGFCGVKTGRPETVDWDEPEKVARSIKIMKIKCCIIWMYIPQT